MTRPDILPVRGAVARPLSLEVTRNLTGADLDLLATAPAVGPPPLQRLRAIHHRQAQLLAGGHTVKEVAAIVGCTGQRLVQLQNDPSFVELMSYYRDQLMVTALDDAKRLQGKITDVGEMAVDELHERLEDEERRKTLPIGEIRKIAEFAMDRTVAPPKSAPSRSGVPDVITISFGTSLNPTLQTAVTIEGNVDATPPAPEET